MGEFRAVKHEFNEWDDAVPCGQGIPAKLFRCGYCGTHFVITGQRLVPSVDYMRQLGWAYTRKYMWICHECNPDSANPDLKDVKS